MVSQFQTTENPPLIRPAWPAVAVGLLCAALAGCGAKLSVYERLQGSDNDAFVSASVTMEVVHIGDTGNAAINRLDRAMGGCANSACARGAR